MPIFRQKNQQFKNLGVIAMFALVGVMATWGQPFHSLAVRGQSAEQSHQRVLVWSDGPNGRAVSMAAIRLNAAVTNGEMATLSGLSLKSGAQLFQGDDIGFVHEE